jgi:glycosyltransferase involved in cell wall biosynthesis
MTSNAMVSVVVPLRNDATILAEAVSELHATLKDTYQHYEVVLVDDGSDDDTAEVAAGLLRRFDFMRYIRLSRSFGEDVAIMVGLQGVIGDFVITFVPNMDDPALIPAMVESGAAGADVVTAECDVRTDLHGLYGFGARAFYWYLGRVLGLDVSAHARQFRCLSRRAVSEILRQRDEAQALRFFASSSGFVRRTLRYHPLNRRGRSTRPRLGHAVDRAITLVIELSPHPLRIVSVTALCAAFFNVLYAVYIVAVYLLKEDVAQGWVTLSSQNALQFFFIALLLAAMAEYLGRILQRVTNRPTYFVREELTSEVVLRHDFYNVVAESTTDGLELGTAPALEHPPEGARVVR